MHNNEVDNYVRVARDRQRSAKRDKTREREKSLSDLAGRGDDYRNRLKQNLTFSRLTGNARQALDQNPARRNDNLAENRVEALAKFTIVEYNDGVPSRTLFRRISNNSDLAEHIVQDFENT